MKIFAWSDSPLAPTGFGRSAKHVLEALHGAGHEIVQLAVNCDPHTLQQIPWKVSIPTDRANDPYGLRDLEMVLNMGRYDAFWTTFDPECPWFMPYQDGQPTINRIVRLRADNPGFKMAGWFPVDGGPLSDGELAVLGLGNLFDIPVTMSPHVYDLIEWTMKLRGRPVDMDLVKQRLRLIPHGVEIKNLSIPTDEERRAVKSRLGIPPDSFLVLQLERNQQRKMNYLGLAVMEKLFQRKPELRGHVVLYQHMNADEENQGCRVGWNLPELAWRYGLQPGKDIFWAPGFIAEQDMIRVYHAADAFLSTSTGEGFQYPAWEALACGVPLVVPNDSARAAYFKNAPNVHLYGTELQSLVLRGGYHRRMNFADAGEAARIIQKMIEGKAAYAPKREAGRVFVATAADVMAVKAQWIGLYAELEEQLISERRSSRLAVGPPPPHSIGWRAAPESAGDLMAAAPALAAFRDTHGPFRLHVGRRYLEVATLMGVAQDYTTDPLPEGGIDLAGFAGKLRDDWFDPRLNRANVFADKLGVPRESLKPYSFVMHDRMKQAATTQFLNQFGVPISDVIALSLESMTPHRSLAPTYYERLAAVVREMGYVPVIFGQTALNITKFGLIDLSGKTDFPTMVTTLGLVRAFVGVDSGPIHWAAAQKTPVVGCYTMVEPRSRLGLYDTKWIGVTPDDPGFPFGEDPDKHKQEWAPYPATNEWGARIRVEQVVAGLKQLLEITQ